MMEKKGIKKIVPSIYTADGQATTADTRHVKDYNQAMELALIYESQGADEIILMDNKTITFTSFCDYYLNNRFYNNKRKHKLLIKTNKGEIKPINMSKK